MPTWVRLKKPTDRREALVPSTGGERTPAIVDIYPTIAEHMRFELPADVAAQLEG